jgi:hypothetical protein
MIFPPVIVYATLARFRMSLAGSFQNPATITLPVQSITSADCWHFQCTAYRGDPAILNEHHCVVGGAGGWRRINLPALEQQSGGLSRRPRQGQPGSAGE